MMNTFIVLVFMAFCVAYSSADNAVAECVICDSGNDINCAQKPDVIIPQKCVNQPNSIACFARIRNGITYRGCFMELDEGIRTQCLNDSTAPGQECFYCENVNGKKGCNDIIFPGHRIRCHHCSGDLKSNCFQGIDSNAIACKTYDPNDKCYIRKTEKNIERGCLSDTDRCNNASYCNICDGEGCNNLNGNSTTIPTAPNSAATWTSTFVTVAIAVLISIQLSS